MSVTGRREEKRGSKRENGSRGKKRKERKEDSMKEGKQQKY